jgi:glycosyltransferase
MDGTFVNCTQMNLYIFNENSRGAVYGIGTYIRELTDVLKKSDIHVTVIHLMSDKPHIQAEETDGISHRYFPAPMLEQRTTSEQEQRERYRQNIVYLLQLYIRDKENLIFHFNFSLYGSLIKALKNAFECRIVSVVHFSDWGFTVFDNLQRLRKILKEEGSDSLGENVKKSVEEEKAYYVKADHCICLSNYMREILCRDYELDAARISVIPNGLEDREELLNKEVLRKKWNIPHREKIILFVGRMDEIKGLNFLIKAFRRVLTFYPQSRLILAGNGDFSKNIQCSQDICAKIVYTGFLNEVQLQKWYRLADIGVIPSLFEPFGFVAVEMMMHRLPIVATATSGMNEVLDDSCALKIPLIPYPDKVEIDTDLLAEKILYLLQHPKEAYKLGKNGRKRYENKYTADIFGQQMLRFYQSLLKQ